MTTERKPSFLISDEAPDFTTETWGLAIDVAGLRDTARLHRIFNEVKDGLDKYPNKTVNTATLAGELLRLGAGSTLYMPGSLYDALTASMIPVEGLKFKTTLSDSIMGFRLVSDPSMPDNKIAVVQGREVVAVITIEDEDAKHGA